MTSGGLTKRAQFRRDTPKDRLEIPHHGPLGTADHAGGARYVGQRQRRCGASSHAGPNQSYRLDFAGHLFDADKEYDADYNCEVLFWMHIMPNIKQRKDAVNRGKPSRKNAVGMFGHDEHRKRVLIEGIFETEEARRHQLHCGFVPMTTSTGSQRSRQYPGTYGSSTGLSAPTG